ncbi:MAG: hypothetical protein O7C75_21185 [Verrucomicrobia bacterium]|nr:hypothetical protein [Verrucomicrobiota bacterium]
MLSNLGAKDFKEINRYEAQEARQGVAVDDEHFYAIGNHYLGKYLRSDGSKLAEWACEEGKPLIHLNAGMIVGDKLYCSHSNYPGVPATSSIEIFDTANLKHIGSYSLGHGYGSLTWIDRRDGKWYACFAFYGNRAKEPGRDPNWTQVVEFDNEWRRLRAWTFPPELVEKFGEYSCSGGAFGPDGRLYITGHDHPELYVIEFPEAGSIFRWVDTLSIPAEGQAFAWDTLEEWTLFTIIKADRVIIVSRANHQS